MKLADLCLSHFLNAAEAIVENAEALRELNARALGEVAIREAITEVKYEMSGTEQKPLQSGTGGGKKSVQTSVQTIQLQ